jgi:hypothetical protein
MKLKLKTWTRSKSKDRLTKARRSWNMGRIGGRAFEEKLEPLASGAATGSGRIWRFGEAE